MSTSKKTTRTPDFEKSLERLEKIVQEMEDGDLPLEKMMQHFEEGMRLLRFCSHKLNEVEQKIEVLIKQDEAVQLKPFQPTAENEDETNAKNEDTTGL
ncbi:MAG: exodeoxyribonuclease VII small subunit [Kiritimatiellia bacterium]|jgi:exodeoxyribonuclease VII small subunit